MQDTISIKNAISRGMRMINFPVLAIMFLPWIAIGLVSHFLITPQLMPHIFEMILFIPLLFLSFVSIPLAWLWWSIQVPKWKLWAYAKVDDVIALKIAAIRAGLIWPDGCIFEKTEICSNAVRQQIRQLEGRV